MIRRFPSNRNRRGAGTLEFALTFPIFFLMVVAIVEYGWLLFVRTNVGFAAHAGCRAGSVIPPPDPDDGGSHEGEAVATSTISKYLETLSIDCAEDDGDCDITAELTGSSPTEVISCNIEMTYDPIIGILPVPEQLVAGSLSRMEIQR